MLCMRDAGCGRTPRRGRDNDLPPPPPPATYTGGLRRDLAMLLLSPAAPHIQRPSSSGPSCTGPVPLFPPSCEDCLIGSPRTAAGARSAVDRRSADGSGRWADHRKFVGDRVPFCPALPPHPPWDRPALAWAAALPPYALQDVAELLQLRGPSGAQPTAAGGPFVFSALVLKPAVLGVVRSLDLIRRWTRVPLGSGTSRSLSQRGDPRVPALLDLFWNHRFCGSDPTENVGCGLCAGCRKGQQAYIGRSRPPPPLPWR